MADRRPPTFAELQAEWNARLASSGLEDIESQKNPDGPTRHRYVSGVDMEAVGAYYDQASDWYRRRGSRLKPRDRKIVRLHVGGATYREIASQVGLGRHGVQRVIHRFQALMEQSGRLVTRRSDRGRGSVQVKVRLSDSEAEALQTLAHGIGRTVSYTLRALLIAAGTTPSKRDELAAVIAEIAEAER